MRRWFGSLFSSEALGMAVFGFSNMFGQSPKRLSSILTRRSVSLLTTPIARSVIPVLSGGDGSFSIGKLQHDRRSHAQRDEPMKVRHVV